MARRKRKGSIVTREMQGGTRYRARIRIRAHDHYGPWRDSRRRAEQDLQSMQNMDDEIVDLLDAVTLEHAWRAHLQRLEARGTKDSTIRGYRLKWGALMHFFRQDAPIAAIDPGDVEAYVRFRKADVKMRTIHHELSLLRAICNTAIKRQWLKTNPVAQAEMPRVTDEKLPDWFTRAELAALLIRIRSLESGRDPEADADLMEFLALTGLRLTEASELAPTDLDLQRRLIFVRRGKRGQRTARITDRLLPICQRILKRVQEGVVFGSPEQIKWLFRYWRERLDEPRLHPHTMRHTFASALARLSGSPWAVMQALGHSNIRMSLKYCHMAGVDLEHLEALSFDAAEPGPVAGPDDEASA